MTCPPPEQVARISTRMGLESLPGMGSVESGPPLVEHQEGAFSAKGDTCPLCGGKLRVEVLTLVYPEPGLLRIAECLGRGDSYDERGCRRSRPKPPCGRWRT